jgi:hypothetical protein
MPSNGYRSAIHAQEWAFKTQTEVITNTINMGVELKFNAGNGLIERRPPKKKTQESSWNSPGNQGIPQQ